MAAVVIVAVALALTACGGAETARTGGADTVGNPSEMSPGEEVRHTYSDPMTEFGMLPPSAGSVWVAVTPGTQVRLAPSDDAPVVALTSDYILVQVSPRLRGSYVALFQFPLSVSRWPLGCEEGGDGPPMRPSIQYEAFIHIERLALVMKEHRRVSSAGSDDVVVGRGTPVTVAGDGARVQVGAHSLALDERTLTSLPLGWVFACPHSGCADPPPGVCDLNPEPEASLGGLGFTGGLGITTGYGPSSGTLGMGDGGTLGMGGGGTLGGPREGVWVDDSELDTPAVDELPDVTLPFGTRLFTRDGTFAGQLADDYTDEEEAATMEGGRVCFSVSPNVPGLEFSEQVLLLCASVPDGAPL